MSAVGPAEEMFKIRFEGPGMRTRTSQQLRVARCLRCTTHSKRVLGGLTGAAEVARLARERTAGGLVPNGRVAMMMAAGKSIKELM